LDSAELRRSLSERLPDYMTPSFIVAIDEFPLTRNGKIDLNALPAPETVRSTRDENYVAPRNEIEATITRVWQEVLGVERIGVNDNFFDAGGHSLLMVQVHNKLGELFDKKISIVEMFAKPTIGALAEYFSETNGHKLTFEKVMDRAARRRQHASARQ
ncbi:MAG TPA: phosphopantetheine-binding protein, partial [Pyrinomonadaceae bacterium]|nr:phosphopantetheine-binding protein [Pyrinomonadaceae bacterium]